MGKVKRTIAAVFGIVLLVFFLSFRRDFTQDGAETRTDLQVGVWFSPWGTWSEVRHDHFETTPNGGSVKTAGWERSWNVDLFSWSWPSLVAGLVLIGWSRRRAPSA
jgi:hypothetical protein